MTLIPRLICLLETRPGVFDHIPCDKSWGYVKPQFTDYAVHVYE